LEKSTKPAKEGRARSDVKVGIITRRIDAAVSAIDELTSLLPKQ
jgi:hypothetical protein